MAGVILIFDAFPARQARRGDLVIQHHRRIGKIVEQAFQPIMEIGQPMLHSRMFTPGADRLVQGVIGAGCAKFDPVVLAKAGDGGLVEDNLRDRGQIDRRQLFHCPLAGRIKSPRPVQNIAKQIQTHRAALPRRIDVDDAATHRIIAGFGHGGGLRKPHAHQIGAQGGLVHPAPNPGGKGGTGHHIARRQTLGCRTHRCQQNERAAQAARQRRQSRHARR